MFSIFVLIPTADNIMSALIVSSPLEFLTFAVTPFPEVSTDNTSEDVITFIPLFLNDFSNSFEISLSSTGTIFGKYSTIVTLVPIEL